MTGIQYVTDQNGKRRKAFRWSRSKRNESREAN
jgi:hypothetical protein